MWELSWWEVLAYFLLAFVWWYVSLLWIVVAAKAVTHGVVSEFYRLKKLHKETGNGDKD